MYGWRSGGGGPAASWLADGCRSVVQGRESIWWRAATPHGGEVCSASPVKSFMNPLQDEEGVGSSPFTIFIFISIFTSISFPIHMSFNYVSISNSSSNPIPISIGSKPTSLQIHLQFQSTSTSSFSSKTKERSIEPNFYSNFIPKRIAWAFNRLSEHCASFDLLKIG